jgi:hypothetical protein
VLPEHEHSPTTRRAFIGVLVSSGLAAPAFLDDASAAPARASGDDDAAILNYALGLEYLQAAFYRDAVDAGRLPGDLARFARVVAGHEAAHVAYLLQALGSKAGPAPRFRFGDAVRDREEFVRTAITLEDLAVQAYNGAGPSLSPTALAAAARVVSVDGRHAAWIRVLARLEPAAEPLDPGIPPAEVTRAVRRLGFGR